MRPAVNLVLTSLCLGFTAAAAYNVYASNDEVVSMATRLACGDVERGGCTVTRESRNPVAQHFLIQTQKKTVGVVCARAAWFVGRYDCRLE